MPGLRLLLTFFIPCYLILSPIQSLLAQNPTIDSLRGIIYTAPPTTDTGKLKTVFSITSQFTRLDSDSALKYAEMGVEMASLLNDSSQLFLAYRKLGRIKGMALMNMEGMLEEGKKALALATVMKDSTKMALAGIEIGMSWPAIEMEGAISHTQQAIQLLEGLVRNDDNENLYTNLIDACGNLGYLYLYSDVEKSNQLRRKAVAYARKIGDDRRLAIQLAALGTSYRNFGNDSAIVYFQQAGEIFKAVDNPVNLSLIYSEIAQYYSDLNYADSVLKYAQLAIEMGERTGNIETIRTSNRLLADFFLARDEYEEALSYAMKQLEVEENNPSGHLPQAMNGVADVYLAQGDDQEAESWYRKAIASARELKIPTYQAIALLKLGDLAFKDQAYRQALDYYKQARQLDKKEVKDLYQNRIAQCQFNMGQYGKARESWQNILENSQAELTTNYRRAALRGLASADSALGSYGQAYQHLLAFSQLNDTLLTRQYSDRVAEVETELKTAQKEATIKEMEQEDEIQLLQLAQTSTQRNFFIILAAVLGLATAAIGYLFVRIRENRKQIQAQADQLKELNATKDRIFGIIAHDLRGPVSGFQTLGKIFSHHLRLDNKDKLLALSDKVEKQSIRLKSLLDNLLQWSLQQLGTYRPQWEQVLLNSLGREVVALYEESSRAKENEISLDIPESLIVKGDKNGLLVVLNNLLSNAIKFTEKGKIWLKAQTVGENLYLEVGDTGNGMTPEQLAEFREKGNLDSEKGTAGEGGTGLGLNLVLQLVRQWGGELDIQSEVDQGTQVQINLPLN